MGFTECLERDKREELTRGFRLECQLYFENSSQWVRRLGDCINPNFGDCINPNLSSWFSFLEFFLESHASELCRFVSLLLVGLIIFLFLREPSLKGLNYAEQPLLEEEAKELVERFFRAKFKIFGKNHDLELAKEITDGNRYDEIKAEVSKMSSNSYIEFGELNVEPRGFFCPLDKGKVEIHLGISHPYIEYKDGNPQQPEEFDQEFEGAFGLQYIYKDKAWKLVEEGEADNANLSDKSSLPEFRREFWDRDPLIVEDECRQLITGQKIEK